MTNLYVTTVPIFKVDRQVREELARDVSLLEIEEATDGLKTLTLRLKAQAPKGNAREEQQHYLDSEITDFGKEIEASIGPSDSARIIFTGLISGIEAIFVEAQDPHVVIYAEDKLMQLRMTRRMKTWEDMSDAAIAGAIASQHGLTGDTAAPGPTYKVVQQWNQSDLAFLRERARLIQAEVWLESNKLCFKTRGNRSGTSITLVQGRDLIDVRLRADLAHQRSKIKASGFDAKARDMIDEEAGSEVIKAEISGGRTGPAVLRQAFGERVSYRVRETPLIAGEANAWARAEMLRRCRGFVMVVGTTNGTPDMVVGSKLNLDRVGEPFSGDGYYAVRVCHTYDQTKGHRTHFEAQRATINGASS